LTPNFSPPNHCREAARGAFDLRAGKSGTWATKFGREKLFLKKMFAKNSRCKSAEISPENQLSEFHRSNFDLSGRYRNCMVKVCSRYTV